MIRLMEALIEADKVISAFNKKGTETADKLAELVTRISGVYQANIMREAPVNKNTYDKGHAGQLKSSIRVEDISPLEARVFQDEHVAKYAKWVLGGRGPVFPKKKKALFWPGLAHPVPRAGPAPANPFWDRGIRRSQSEKKEAINEFEQWLKEIG